MSEEELIGAIEAMMREEVTLVRLIGPETVAAIRMARMVTPSNEAKEILEAVYQNYMSMVGTLSEIHETLTNLIGRAYVRPTE